MRFSAVIHGDAHGSRRMLAVECGFAVNQNKGIDSWGIHDDAHGSRQILAVDIGQQRSSIYYFPK